MSITADDYYVFSVMTEAQECTAAFLRGDSSATEVCGVLDEVLWALPSTSLALRTLRHAIADALAPKALTREAADNLHEKLADALALLQVQ